MEDKNPLVRILMRHSSQEYTVYDDGTVDGFGDGAIIFDHIEAVVGYRVEKALRNRQGLKMGLTSDMSGVAQAVPS